jgi:CheY-like chemotaxis protein
MPNEAPSGRGRLLAIDDNADSAELVARQAARCGYEVRFSTNPKTVPALLGEWMPEVLTLDLCMPDADGIDMISMLVESGFTGQLVIISGQDGWFRKAAQRLAAARGLNVAGDLEKPVDLRALRHLLSGLSQAA